MRWLGPLQALYFAIHRLLGTYCISLRVPGSATPLLCRQRDSDLGVLWSAFFWRDCDCELPASHQTIIDAGANVGYVSVFFRQQVSCSSDCCGRGGSWQRGDSPKKCPRVQHRRGARCALEFSFLFPDRYEWWKE